MRQLAVLGLVLLLAGCLTTGKRGGDGVLVAYDFGPAPSGLLDAPRRIPVALEVRAPLWLDSMGITYRLAYGDAARLREYAQARWVGPPAQMLQQRLIQALAYSTPGQGQVRCLWRFEMSEFSQVFTSPETSTGLLQGRFTLFDRARREVASRRVSIEHGALSPDARGGVGGLAAAVEQLAADLLVLERTLAANGNAGDCFG